MDYKKYIKNVEMIFILILVLLMPIQVQAAELGSKDPISGSVEVVNTNFPKSARVSSTENVQAPQYKSSNNQVVYSLSDLGDIIKYNMNNRNAGFSIDYKGDTSTLKSDIDNLIQGILDQDDYLNYSYRSYSFNYSGYESDVTVNFSFEYLTTKSQESYVNSRVSIILGQIINSSMSSGQKEKNIHDYIVKNVQYDTSLTRFSAYNALSEGKTVCHGYALLAYKMLKEAGVENRIIPGEAYNGEERESHAWNLVQLKGYWYHLDCTWDDPVPDIKGRVLYDYYNLTDSKIGNDHYWNHSLYPRATMVYDESSSDIQVKTSVSGVSLSSESLLLKVGKTAALKVAINPSDADNKSLTWKSDNSSVVTVDSNGNIKALSEGNAVVSVKTEDGGYTDSCVVDVVSSDGVNLDFSSYKKWNDSSRIVSKNKMWSVKFTKVFDPSTVNNDTVLVYKQYNNVLYSIKDISVTYNGSKNIIYVTPLKGYTSGTYYLVITQRVLSKDGKVIPKPIVLTFKI